MNVLILTPDRVGSTLLQRLITVYANILTFNDISKQKLLLSDLKELDQ